jgi:hypothetical protein
MVAVVIDIDRLKPIEFGCAVTEAGIACTGDIDLGTCYRRLSTTRPSVTGRTLTLY